MIAHFFTQFLYSKLSSIEGPTSFIKKVNRANTRRFQMEYRWGETIEI